MNITIKNVKHNEALSEETHCFSATVYVNGKRAFGIKNAGHGGEDDVYSVDNKTHREVLDMYAEVDHELGKEQLPMDERFPEIILNNCLEIVVGDLVNNWLTDKVIKRHIKKVCYVKRGEDGVHVSKHIATEQHIEGYKKASWFTDEFKILNGLPIEELRQYF